MNDARTSAGHAHGISTAGGNANPSTQIPTSMRGSPGVGTHAPSPSIPAARAMVVDEPLALSDEAPPQEAPKSKIHGISGMTGLSAHLSQQEFKRGLHNNKTGAVRMRTFHCRLSEQGVEYLDQAINGWLDTHPEVEVKFSTSVIGMWDGKLKEPALIINVWY